MISPKYIQTEKGYAAMISVVIITALLTTIALGAGMSGSLLRLDILDAEGKEQSSALARGCLEYARLEAAKGNYPSNETITIGPLPDHSCTIISSEENTPEFHQTLVIAQAAAYQAHTTLQAVIANEDFSITSLKECPSPDSC